ncbi:MAG: TM2 domain-containing protein [Burkholderiales bacterium]|nr:TM2 domain-containing protein [Burkholderiales bacterium]
MKRRILSLHAGLMDPTIDAQSASIDPTPIKLKEEIMIFCRQCGKEIHESASICPNCGAPQRAQGGAKSQNVALVLAALLGPLGAHRFYLGKIVSGIFYLLFCWTGIPGLIALVECFVIAFTDQLSWARKYNYGMLVPPVHIALKLLLLMFPFMIIAGLLTAVVIPQYERYEKNRIEHSAEAPPEQAPQVQEPTQPENPEDAASAPQPGNVAPNFN